MRTKETINGNEAMGYPWLMDEKPIAEVDLVDLLYRLVDKVKYVLLAAVVFGLAFGAAAKQQVRTMYFADASLYILGNTEELTLSDIQLANNMMSNYIAIFSNTEVHQAVLDAMDLTYTTDQLARMVSVSNIPGTHILSIGINSTKAQEAVQLANTYAEVASEFIDEVMKAGKMTVWEEAREPVAFQSPDVMEQMLRGACLGAVLAFAVVVIQILLDDRVRTTDQIEKGLGVPSLGVMTLQKKNWEGESYESYE